MYSLESRDLKPGHWGTLPTERKDLATLFQAGSSAEAEKNQLWGLGFGFYIIRTGLGVCVGARLGIMIEVVGPGVGVFALKDLKVSPSLRVRVVLTYGFWHPQKDPKSENGEFLNSLAQSSAGIKFGSEAHVRKAERSSPETPPMGRRAWAKYATNPAIFEAASYEQGKELE